MRAPPRERTFERSAAADVRVRSCLGREADELQAAATRATRRGCVRADLIEGTDAPSARRRDEAKGGRPRAPRRLGRTHRASSSALLLLCSCTRAAPPGAPPPLSTARPALRTLSPSSSSSPPGARLPRRVRPAPPRAPARPPTPRPSQDDLSARPRPALRHAAPDQGERVRLVLDRDLDPGLDARRR